MLEFALRQERAKYQKLQFGVEHHQQKSGGSVGGAQSSEGLYPCLFISAHITSLFIRVKFLLKGS